MDEKWHSLLSSVLHGKKWRKHINSIIFHLKCINRGIKPSFLWDIGPSLELNSILKLVNTLKSESVLEPYVYVLLYETEVFIINLKGCLMFLETFSNSLKFININSNLTDPKLMDGDEGTEIISALKENIFSFLSIHRQNLSVRRDCLHLRVDKNFYPPSVFGLLLGYPVIYWKDTKANSDSNCLSHIPLSVYRLQLKEESLSGVDQDCNLYSFSVPVSLNLTKHIGVWLSTLQSLYKVKFQIVNENVTMPSVQL